MQKITLSLGLNDKDTKTQLIPTEKAELEVAAIMAREFGFATISRAVGVYTHENGEIVIENTLVIALCDVPEDKARAIAEKLRVRFNQESIGFECQTVNFELIEKKGE